MLVVSFIVHDVRDDELWRRRLGVVRVVIVVVTDAEYLHDSLLLTALDLGRPCGSGCWSLLCRARGRRRRGTVVWFLPVPVARSPR